MPDERIEGWKNIADYLNRHRRTVERARSKGLPIHKEGRGPKARVWASKSELDAWKSGSEAFRNEQSLRLDPEVLTPIGKIDRSLVFSYPGGYASAIVLYGRGEAFISPERLLLTYEHDKFELPMALRDEAARRIVDLRRRSEKKNELFFNGPTVRLKHWHHNQRGAAELDTLKLVMGPVGWFDFEGSNGVLRDQLKRGIQGTYRKYVDLPRITHDGDLEHASKLSNMIGNAITIFTSDGNVSYQVRGHRQSAVPGQLTSSVAESVNRYLDDTDPKNASQLINNIRHDMWAGSGTDNEYKPKGIPHLLASVRRGIQEEISPRLLEHIGPLGIKLSGLAFGLDNLHPDALWIVLVDTSEARIRKMRRDNPGKDAFEGNIEFLPASFGASRTQSILNRTDWVPAGKASLVRAIELINAISPGNPDDAFDILARSH